jgi:hypothetical protein
MCLDPLSMSGESNGLDSYIGCAGSVEERIERRLSVHHDFATVWHLNRHIGSQHFVVLAARAHLLGEGTILHHSGVFYATLQLQLTPVAAGLGEHVTL